MRLIILAGLVSVLFLSGCASIVSDNQSNTYFETNPECAKCELHGQDFTRVITTPDVITLPAEAAPITVACNCDGYFTTTQVVDTKMDGWIFGNIIFGGIVGGVIDAARGAGQKYPPKITIYLDPKCFDTQEKCDEWYDNRKNSIIAKWDDIIAGIKRNCQGKNQNDNVYNSAKPNCDNAILEAEEKRQAELQLIEERRMNSIIGSEVSQLTR